MTNQSENQRGEIERIRRVADMLCSAHAGLRDRYRRWALALDLGILGLSTWLTGIVFVSPAVNATLTPFSWEPQVWVGVLSIGTMFLSILQLRTDWKARSDAHARTLDVYSEVKREAGYVLAADNWDDDASQRVKARYDLASAVGVAVPEHDFLRQKRRHRAKIAISKHLDSHPSASILLVRIKFWARDNFGVKF